MAAVLGKTLRHCLFMFESNIILMELCRSITRITHTRVMREYLGQPAFAN